ncbi:TPA: ead/Ea22-like family protein [Enterobacter hormaechei]|nr:ead/Ea22-like family protein [Enterobacter hormaechei]HCR0968553.1 ead/Ea22-like family protein [Enterobacter hormaechei]
MSNIDKQALREVAEKATPGPWLWINTGSYFSFLVPQSNQDPHNCIIDDGSSWGEYGAVIKPESPDGVFIASANPATVMALLDELEAKDKQIDDLKATAAHSNAGWTEAHRQEARAEAAEKRIADQCGIIASARKFISEYAGLGDVGAAEFIKIIDRAAAGKGATS